MFMNYWFESDKKGLPGNRSFYENSEVDKLLRNALATTDQTQRTRDYQQAQKSSLMTLLMCTCSRKTTNWR
ncbi:ABC transporter substrate-binding protein [Escherichia coli]|uniref:ABC transporter substrate-binding protein n=1 Tax=Escherichia coli TaxID=562 RepID=A0A377D5W6_ECOLX|nr:ABC transporter substrate-binding protein [Escherichia coli]